MNETVLDGKSLFKEFLKTEHLVPPLFQPFCQPLYKDKSTAFHLKTQDEETESFSQPELIQIHYYIIEK